MELHPSPRIDDPAAPSTSCDRYVELLPIAPSQRRQLLQLADVRSSVDSRESMTRLHELIAGRKSGDENPAHISIQRRLELACGGPVSVEPPVARDVRGRVRLVTMPPFNRTSMVPQSWPRNLFWRLFRHTSARKSARDVQTSGGTAADTPGIPQRSQSASIVRRIALATLILAQTYLATDFMTSVLPYHGTQPLEIAILVFFAILFGWVTAGFWTAIAGFVVLLAGGDRYAISRTAAPDLPIPDTARTAIVMPICNENVPRVFAGLRATYESLARTGALKHFDIFVLSDSNDPDNRVAETVAWLEMCRAHDAFGRVFYRWRQHRIKRKSGNIADFCRRWGRNYRYMIVLDADSVMSGECMTRLVQLMEANPDTGIIQTAPRAAGRDTLHARVQQFATRVYGPVFTAGLHFWQLSESHYWGHNAILRVDPFIRHCALGRLPGSGSLSGEILSHDFVEAALIRRAGWAVWMAYDLPGSYEEMPPNLMDELKRDRRWCQGNLMNFRLFLMEGLHPAHRVVFAIGIMAYISALLWLVSLLLSTALLAVHTLSVPQYFVRSYQLFPLWPEWRPARAMALVGMTATLLFLPKIVSALLICLKGAKEYGGAVRLTLSMLAEIVFSALLAPIRMLFHSQFVIGALIGISVQWKSPPREDAETTWSEAWRRHGWHTLLGVAWAVGVYWLNPEFLWWLLPVVGALILSIPVSVYSSRISLGRRLRKARFFLIPEESHPPPEMRFVRRAVRRAPRPSVFADAVIDPLVNAVVCASATARRERIGVNHRERQYRVRDAVLNGPNSLTASHKTAFLADPVSLAQLHFEIWVAENIAPSWRRVYESRIRNRASRMISASPEAAPVAA